MYSYKRKTTFSENFPFLGKLLGKLLLTALISYFFAYLLGRFFLFPHRFIDSSMAPSYRPGDMIFLSPLVRESSLNYEKLVFSKISESNSSIFIGRILGKPGDRIKIQSKKVFRDNQILLTKTAKNSDSRIFESSFSNRDQLKEITLGKDEFFILCDNRDECMDSREYGAIPLKNIVAIKIFK
jgi:signal peptidase I